MSPERFPPDDPREWLNRARSNLARAKASIPEAYREDLCFDAQQAAEKAIKALLINFGVEFPYVHDIAQLLTVLEKAGRTIPEPIREAAKLTRFAVSTRYPGIASSINRGEYEEALRLAEETLRWVQEQIENYESKKQQN